MAGAIGLKISQRAVAKSLSRWLPLVGAAGVAGYAYYDTSRVASTAITFFQQDLGNDETAVASDEPTGDSTLN